MSYSFLLRVIASSLLGLFFLAVAFGNWRIFVKHWVLRQRSPSTVPVVGGVAGAVALVLAPAHELSRFWALPLFLDWGTLPSICFALYWWKFIYPRAKNQEDKEAVQPPA